MSEHNAEHPLRTPAEAALAMYELGMSVVGLIEGTKRPSFYGHPALGIVRLSRENVGALRGGVALVGGHGFFAVDIDEGGDEARLKVERRLGPCECVVVGRRGWKLIYATAAPPPTDDLLLAARWLNESGEKVAHATRTKVSLADTKAKHAARSRDFRRLLEAHVAEHGLVRSCSRSSPDGSVKIDVLGTGRLIVMPPTIHPATGEPYRYEDGAGLTQTSFFLSREVKAAEVEAMLDELTGSRADPPRKRPGRAVSATDDKDVGRVRAALEHLSSDDRDLWIRIGMALKAELGGEGLEIWDDWSRGSLKYVDGECEEKWEGFDDTAEDGVGLGTLFHEAKQAGWVARTPAADDFKGEAIPETYSSAHVVAKSNESGAPAVPALALAFERNEKTGRVLNTLGNAMLAIASANLGLAYDDLAQRHVLRAPALPWSQDFGRELNDDIMRIIRHFIMSTYGWEPSKENVVEAALTLATESRFNPVCDYLDEREKQWDGIARLDQLLPGYCSSPDGDYERQVGRKFMIAAVRRARKPGCKFDMMPILEGPQGSGKSSAVHILGGTWHSDAPLSNLESKEASMLLQNAWIVENSELTTMSRAMVEQMKAYLSRTEDRFRSPFERTVRTVPRRCVFIGTTNSTGYLRDTTGNRRFFPIKTGRIDIAALARHRDQLWGEAAAAEAGGESIELSRELWAEAAEQQEQRLVEEPWIAKLRDYVERNKKVRISSTELLEDALQLHCSRQSQVETKRLRQAMENLGWKYSRSIRIGGTTTTGYEAPDAAQDLFGQGTTP